MQNEFGATSYPAGHEVTPDERMWGLIAHLSAIGAGVLLCGLSVVGPLIVYLIKKDQSKFVAAHAMQALYFHGAMSLLNIAFFVIMFVLTCLTGGLAMVLYPVIFLVGIAALVYTILAAVRANEGKYFLYPVTGPVAQAKIG